MKKGVFVTGATGFIGSHIIKYLQEEGFPVYALIRKDSVAKFSKTKSLHLIFGDITKKNFGIAKKDLEKLSKNVSYFIHCAALYGTGEPRQKLFEVNVAGTRNALALAGKLSNLSLMSYVSTVYVSGAMEGILAEDSLPAVKSFHNDYEETKYIAESLVRKLKLPAVIFRPPIVVGHSKTGKALRFNGIYKVIEAIYKKRLFFYPGDCHGPIYLVPVDIVAEFISWVGVRDKFKGLTFNLVGPRPPTYREFFRKTARLLKVSSPYFIFPEGLWRILIKLSSIIPFINAKPLLMFGQRLVIENKNYLTTLRQMGKTHPEVKSYHKNILNYFTKKNA